MHAAHDQPETITLEQWKRREQPEQKRADNPQPEPPRRAEVKHRSWADELERRARHCRGCGEWAFTEYCDWCLDAKAIAR